jgi:hypothetical protein
MEKRTIGIAALVVVFIALVSGGAWSGVTARTALVLAQKLESVVVETKDTADSLTLRRAKPTRTAHHGTTDATQHNVAIGNATTSNTTWAEFPVTDIPTKFRSASNAQELTVTNREAAGITCIQTKSRLHELVDGGPNPDCAAIADDAGVNQTCGATPASTDAREIVLPGMQRTFSFGGDECIFYLHSTANADVNLSLSAR